MYLRPVWSRFISRVLLNPVTIAWIKDLDFILFSYLSLVSICFISVIYIHVMSGQHWHHFAGYPRSRDEDAQGSE